MLAERIRGFAKTRTVPPIDERPGCAFGAVIRQRVADQADTLSRLEAKVNALLGGLALFLAVEILKAVRP
ncbi:MAG: hypothetical protein M1401_17380 [Chloroflexi bacterium]|nr:hypothetical protein [Chloroflexota bacterium]